MIVFTANGKEYTCPEELKEITFKQFVDYMNIAETAPSEVLEAAEIESELLDADTMEQDDIKQKLARLDQLKAQIITGRVKKAYTEFKMKVVELFTGLEQDVMKGRKGINIDSLDMLYGLIQNALVIKNYEKEIITDITIDGEKYVIAEGKHQTLGEFLEAAQIEEMNARLGKKQYESMIDIAAILLRKEGEEYSDFAYERNREKFMHLDMQTIADISFFFQQKSETLLKTAFVSLAKAEVERLKAEYQSVSDGTLSLQA
jgi:hypothetical protein